MKKCLMIIIMIATTLVGQWQMTTYPTYKDLSIMSFVSEDTGLVRTADNWVFKVTDVGTSWSDQTYWNTPIGCHHFLYFLNSKVAFMDGASNGYFSVLRSTDGGLWWERGNNVPLAYSNNSRAISFYDSMNGYYLNDQELYRTSDMGGSWYTNHYKLPPDSSINSMCFIDSSRGYIIGDSIYATTNAGQKWINKSSIAGIKIKFFNAANGVAVSKRGVYFSTDSASSWSRALLVFDVIQGGEFISLDTGFVITSKGRIYTTYNRGSSWSVDSTASRGFSLSCLSAFRNTIYVGGEKGMFIKSTDKGKTWVNLSKGTREDLQSMEFAGYNNAFIVGKNGTLCKSSDHGLTWTELPKLTANNLNAVRFVDSTKGIIGGDNGKIFLTSDCGNTWLSSTFTDTTMNVKTIFMRSNSEGFICGSNGKIYKTTDLGRHWSISYDSTTNELNTLTFKDQTTGFCGGSNILLKTTNAGNTWTRVRGSSVSSVNILKITFWSNNSGVMLGDTLRITNDGGQTWNKWSWSQYLNPTDIWIYNNSLIYLLGDWIGYNYYGYSPVSRTDTTFNKIKTVSYAGYGGFNKISPTEDVSSICFYGDEYGFALGKSGSIWQVKNMLYLSWGILDVKNSDNAERINSYALEQNYPNPFNPSTTINYELKTAGRINMKVYDVLGREIVTLVDAEKNAGKYSVNFNAKGLKSGVYFYTFKMDGINITKKMILIK